MAKEGTTMKARIGLRWLVAVAFLTTVVGLVAADKDQGTVRTRLTGLEETTATINTNGSGEFKATISEDGTMIKYEETYRDLSSPITQSHIHFGRPGLSGQIVLYLCTNLTPPVGPPMPQACPLSSPATITGTLTEADVIASPVVGGQGIDAGAEGFAEMVKAIRTGAAYVNVHTTNHPSGEIRGRLGHPRPDQGRRRPA
jgi:CHRD domain-containing protein